MSRPLVCGVGVYERGKYKVADRINPAGKYRITREYNTWSNMLNRCYNSKRSDKNLSYRDNLVSFNFKNFQYFAEWCQQQDGFNFEGWQLDKDVLFKGNKIYSEDTCVFVPKDINMLLTSSNSKRGECPIGVYFNKKAEKYSATISCGSGSSYLGYFDDVEDAFYAYKNTKEKYIKTLAEKYKGGISQMAYISLMNYEVEITD